MQITEEWILAHAPSPAVAAEGRMTSESGRFSSLRRSEDGKAWWAECSGSAPNPYHVSVDWSVSEQEPLYTCSCASRHFPCKHVVGLLYEICAGKTASAANVPAYISRARIRYTAEKARAESRLSKARAFDAATRVKKAKGQLTCLAKAERLSAELLQSGSDTFLPSGALERLAAELGNSSLPGAKDAFENIARLDRALRRDEKNAPLYRSEILRMLTVLHAMIRKARSFLAELLSSGSIAMEDPVLYEALGGVWNSDELREIGMLRRHVRLAQLSFDVTNDEAKRSCVQRAFWLELDRGDIVHTRSVRAVKAPRVSAADDSCFDLLEIPVLYETPVAPCPRVWWDSATVQSPTEEELASLRSYAGERIRAAVEAAKKQLREPLLPGYVPVLLKIGALGFAGETAVLEDGAGDRLVLRDRREDALPSVSRLRRLPVVPAAGDALFGLLFHDDSDGCFCLHPYSLVTADDVIRLQF